MPSPSVSECPEFTTASPVEADLPAATAGPIIPDAELLRRFQTHRDERAFTELVTRFGSLVYAVALRSLRDRHAAEDVFQATFLILARQAGKVRQPDSLAAWLHGVALRISRKALSRRPREVPVESVSQLPYDAALRDRLAARVNGQLLDEELQNLPERYRTPLVLHYLEGKTTGETAAALGATEGAVRGRLQRGRQELKQRLARRGIEVSGVLGAVSASASVGEAAVRQQLVATTVQGGMAMARGTTFALTCSSEAVHLATQETVMLTTILTTGKVLTCAAAMAATTTLGWYGHAGVNAMQHGGDGSIEVLDQAAFVEAPVTEDFTIVDPEFFETGTMLVYVDDKDAPKERKPVLTLKYDDGKPEGKKSIAGTGEAILFTLPDKSQKLRSLRVHCARYGTPQPPNEEAEFAIVSEDGKEVIHTEMVPYAKFGRGESRWTTVQFEEAVEVPEKFWVILQFNAEQTKGVYVSFDTSTGGKYSKTGVAGGEFSDVNTGGDWMVQAILTKPE